MFSGHMMLASLVKAQEFALDDGEAKALALATINVSRHYGTTISAKSMDWANLIMVVGTVYGTRLMTIKMRRNAERQARRAAQQEAKPTHTTVDVNAVPVYDESAFNGAQFG